MRFAYYNLVKYWIKEKISDSNLISHPYNTKEKEI